MGLGIVVDTLVSGYWGQMNQKTLAFTNSSERGLGWTYMNKENVWFWRLSFWFTTKETVIFYPHWVFWELTKSCSSQNPPQAGCVDSRFFEWNTVILCLRVNICCWLWCEKDTILRKDDKLITVFSFHSPHGWLWLWIQMHCVEKCIRFKIGISGRSFQIAGQGEPSPHRQSLHSACLLATPPPAEWDGCSMVSHAADCKQTCRTVLCVRQAWAKPKMRTAQSDMRGNLCSCTDAFGVLNNTIFSRWLFVEGMFVWYSESYL